MIIKNQDNATVPQAKRNVIAHKQALILATEYAKLSTVNRLVIQTRFENNSDDEFDLLSANTAGYLPPTPGRGDDGKELAKLTYFTFLLVAHSRSVGMGEYVWTPSLSVELCEQRLKSALAVLQIP